MNEGSDAGSELRTEHEPISIGKGRLSDLRLTDAMVSRRHAEIRLTRNGYLLVDLGSKNGTYVDGTRVEQAYLKPGAVFRVGETSIDFQPRDRRLQVSALTDNRFGQMVGQSFVMRTLFGVIAKVARLSATVMIRGETGTGKELVARAIHDHSPRREGPFVVVDCGAISPNLIESHLFGHEKGAFTGAVQAHVGAFEAANGGTVFLDELGELALPLQPKLLRLLQERVVQRVGGRRAKKLDVRVIAATHRDLEQAIADGEFRADLYYRLCVVPLEVPSLRERREDIPLLVEHLLERLGGGARSIAAPALAKLEAHDWPGNVRELANVLESAAVLAPGSRVTVDDLPPRLGRAASPKLDLDEVSEGLSFKDAKDRMVDEFERRYLENLLRSCHGNISEAARRCGMHRKSIERLLKKHGIRPRDLT